MRLLDPDKNKTAFPKKQGRQGSQSSLEFGRLSEPEVTFEHKHHN